MKDQKNIEVVRRYFEALAKGELAQLGQLLAEDIVWHQPGQGALSGTYRGKEKVFELFGRFLKISGNSFKIDQTTNIMANGDWVSATLHFSARKPSGQSIAMNGVDLMRVENEKIKEVYLFSAQQREEDEFWRES